MKTEKVKPYNSGQWPEARMRSFVMSALRQARWPVKYDCIKKAFTGRGENPATGHECKLHTCPVCKKSYPQNKMKADHMVPVIPVDGKWSDSTRYLGYNWNDVIPRLYCETDNFQAMCKHCHDTKSAEEKKQRKLNK